MNIERNRDKMSKLNVNIAMKNKLSKEVQSKFKLQVDKVVVVEY